MKIPIYRDITRRLFELSQSMYIDIIIKRFDIENCNKCFILIRHGVHISKEHSPMTLEERALIEKIPYASTIASIKYTVLCTRQDVIFALSVTNRLFANLGQRYWEIVKCILK